MNKKLNQNVAWVVVLVVIVLGAYLLMGGMNSTPPNVQATTSPTTTAAPVAAKPVVNPGTNTKNPTIVPKPVPSKGVVTTDYHNATYTIEGTPVKLVNGTAVTSAAPGSASLVTTQYFGDGSSGDLNGDGKDDTAFLLTQTTGGSGTFYYIAVALKTSSGYTGTNTYLIGDRISPQSTSISRGVVAVNYAERKPGEPMTTIPSVGQTKYFKVTNGTLFATNAPTGINY